MSDSQNTSSGIPDKVKAVGLAVFLILMFIINQIYYHANKGTNENKGSNSSESTQYVYEDRNINEPDMTEDIEKQLEESRRASLVELLQLQSYDDVAYDGVLWDGKHYVVAKSDAKEIRKGILRYIVETDEELYLKNIAWNESGFSLNNEIQDPLQVSAKFTHLFFGINDDMDQGKRESILEDMKANIDTALVEDISDPSFPTLGKRNIATVTLNVLDDEELVEVTILLADDVENDHVSTYTLFSTYVAYNLDSDLWQVVDMDVRKEGDNSGLQDGYRLY